MSIESPMGMQPSPHGIAAAAQSPPADRAQLQDGAGLTVVQPNKTGHPLLQGSASVSLQIFSNLGAIQISPKKPCPQVS